MKIPYTKPNWSVGLSDMLQKMYILFKNNADVIAIAANKTWVFNSNWQLGNTFQLSSSSHFEMPVGVSKVFPCPPLPFSFKDRYLVSCFQNGLTRAGIGCGITVI